MIRLISILIFIVSLSACSIISTQPIKKTSQERFESFPTANLPLRDSVSVYWNSYMVPFIDANTDADAAFVLGLTHAHLRLAQMELFRMIAWGRLAEMAGPLVADIDHSLRTIQLQKSTPYIAANDSPFTRNWIASYVDGINWYIDHTEEKPIEYKLFNITPRRWEVTDVYAVSRLLSADLTWGVYFQALSLMNRPDWSKTWENFLNNGQRSIPSFPNDEMAALNFIINAFSKSGSNSVAVSSHRSYSGSTLMVSDPHLGIFAPNMWLLVGYKSPSFHTVGMQIPGIPIMLLGRNRHYAWGGTNMRAISSHVFELPNTDTLKIAWRTDTIKIRWWPDRTIRLGDSDYGTIISDAPLLSKVGKNLALNWVGHEPTFEVSAFLQSNRATNFDEFREAFANYKVSGQNLLYADEQGNIGQILAYGQPVLRNPQKTLDIVKPAVNSIVSIRKTFQQPYLLNPRQGFIASANNLPIETDIPIAYEFSGHSRMQRMAWYFEKPKVALSDMVQLQLDAFSVQNTELRDYLVEKFLAIGLNFNSNNIALWQALVGWDGHYSAGSSGAAAFETFSFRLAEQLFNDLITDKKLRKRYFDSEFWAWNLRSAIDTLPNDQLAKYARKAYVKASRDFKKAPVWSEMHRIQFGPLQTAIPWVGKRFVLNDLPLEGTSHTLNKSAHEFSAQPHRIGYGSNSRHISDLGDKDANYFVLLGGQDGWTSSPHNNDQIDLWQKGKYIKFPLLPETIKKTFTHRVFKFGKISIQ